MGELTYYVATSLDGFIAQSDGSFEGFAWDDEVVADFLNDLKAFDTVLMGRKTYDVGLREGKTSPYPNMRQILFSRSLKTSPDPAVELISANLTDFVASLRREDCNAIWLCGGGEVATELLAENLIDRLVVKLNPTVFGAGIPLFNDRAPLTRLQLESCKRYDCGIVFLNYKVLI